MSSKILLVLIQSFIGGIIGMAIYIHFFYAGNVDGGCPPQVVFADPKCLLVKSAITTCELVAANIDAAERLTAEINLQMKQIKAGTQ